MRYTPGAESPINFGDWVKVVDPDSFFHGCEGEVVNYSRTGGWGRLVVEIKKNGVTYNPEIKRGRLVRAQRPMPPGSEASRE